MASRTDYDRYIGFPLPEDRDEVAAMLKAEGIPLKTVDNANQFDAFFTYNKVNVAYSILIPAERFEEADRILERSWNVEPEQVPEDYHLREFSDEELIEILIKSDEWGIEDRVIAKALLQARDKEPDPEEIARKRDEWRWEKVKPVTFTTGNTLLVLFFSLFMPPVFFIAGVWILQARRRAPDGSRVNYYDEQSRGQAIVMILFSFIGLFLLLYLMGIRSWHDFTLIFS